jgi:hypothetical protein
MSFSLFLELIIAVALIALLLVYCHREVFLGEAAVGDVDDDRSPPLIAPDHPMRINSRSQFDALISRKQDTIIFVGAPWCGYCHSAISAFMEAADGHKGKAYVLEVKGKELTRLVEDIGVNGFPAILKAHGDGTRSKYDGERTTTAFREYLNDDKKTENVSNAAIESDGDVARVDAEIADTSQPMHVAQVAEVAAVDEVAEVSEVAPVLQVAQTASSVVHVADKSDSVRLNVDSLILGPGQSLSKAGASVPVAVVVMVVSSDGSGDPVKVHVMKNE